MRSRAVLFLFLGTTLFVLPQKSHTKEKAPSATVFGCEFEAAGRRGSILLSRTKDFEVSITPGGGAKPWTCRYKVDEIKAHARRPEPTYIVRARRPRCGVELPPLVPPTIDMEIFLPESRIAEAFVVFGSGARPSACRISKVSRRDLAYIASRGKPRFSGTGSLERSVLKSLESEKPK